MKETFSKIGLTFLSPIFLLSACAAPAEQNPVDTEGLGFEISTSVDWGIQIEQLEQNRTLWENQHITHYRMSVTIPWGTDPYGSLPRPLTVEVDNENVLSVMDALDNIVPYDDEVAEYTNMIYGYYFTIPGLFDHLLEIYSDHPVSMDVYYDSTFGYPKSVFVDPYNEPCCQEYMILMEDFQILSP